jgi:HAMP domain-containing protein
MLSTLRRNKTNVEYTMVAGVINIVSKDELFLANHSVNELANLVEDVGVRGVLDSGC